MTNMINEAKSTKILYYKRRIREILSVSEFYSIVYRKEKKEVLLLICSTEIELPNLLFLKKKKYIM